MTDPPRIYLDHAATSFPKPAQVLEAIDRYQHDIGLSIGRGTSRFARRARDIADRCRQDAAQYFGLQDPSRVIFTFGGTDGLNLLLHGLIEPGDWIVSSGMDHNATLRPLTMFQQLRGCRFDILPCNRLGYVDLDAARRALRERPQLLVINHASNVTGAVQPLAELCEMAREASVPTIVDACQTAGHVPLNLRQVPADYMACSGHKGLHGPLGVGLVLISPDAPQLPRLTYRLGGTGVRSEEAIQPAELPAAYESGSLNAPGIAGLGAAFEWLAQQDQDARTAHEQALVRQFLVELAEIDAVEVHGPPADLPRTPVVSVTLSGWNCHDVAAVLDDSFGIEVRAGLHCAPQAHKTAGTFELGGSVRFSFGPSTTRDDVGAAVDALKQIASG